jgi:hypothetical protein
MTHRTAALFAGWMLLAGAMNVGAQPVLWSQDAFGGFTGADLTVPRGGRIASLVQTTINQQQLTLRDTGTGLPVWTQSFPGYYVGPFRHLAMDSNGDLIVQSGTASALRLAKYAAADGALVWESLHARDGDTEELMAVAMAVDSANHTVVAGNSCIFFFADRLCDGWLERHDLAGVTLWRVKHGTRPLSPPFGGDSVRGIVLDASHNIIVTGNYSVAKYDAATGSALWTVDFQACCGSVGVTVDGAGDAFVVSYDDFAAVLRISKLSGVDGGTVWTTNVPQPRFYYPGLKMLATPGGDLVLAFDRVTRIHSGADGALRWTHILPSGIGDIALDPEGNVLSARSTGTGSIQSVGALLVKQRGTDGQVIANLPLESGTSGARASTVVADESGIYVGVSIEVGQSFAGRVVKIAGDVTTRPPIPGLADFNGDRKADLMWQDNGGRAALWGMVGLQPVFTQELPAPPSPGFRVAFVGDIDGDGKSDLVWQDSGGPVYIWYMDGATVVRNLAYYGSSNGGPAVAMADLDVDGTADLMLQLADGSVMAWMALSKALNQQDPKVVTILGPGTGWLVSRLADFNGDGYPDILFRYPDGRYAIWLMNGATPVTQTQILNAGAWTATHVADLDGDGKADIVWQHADGTIAVWLMNGAAMASGATLIGPGSGWSVTLVGDFDGDGKADLFFTHTDGRAAIYLMNGLAPTQTTQILNAGSGWTARLLTDLNGDGKADIVWQHTDGRVAAWLMNGTAMIDGSEILGPGTGWSVNRANQ